MDITTDQTEKQRSVAILPLLSRIDRLETAMRRLEMKQSSSPSGCSTANTAFSPSSGVTSEQQLPVALDLDVALKETSFKGALLERIKTLENRLFQLRLRVESEKMEARSRRDHQYLPSSSCSFPIFMMSDNPNCNSAAAYRKHVIPTNTSSMITNTNYLETQRQAILEAKEEEEEEEGNITSCKEDEESGKCKLQKMKKKKKSNKDSKNEHEKRRTNKKKKKKAMSKAEREKIKSHNWTHFKILGC